MYPVLDNLQLHNPFNIHTALHAAMMLGQGFAQLNPFMPFSANKYKRKSYNDENSEHPEDHQNLQPWAR